MRKSLKLSAIALLTTAMTALPAYALSLNLGGDEPLVDLGNDNNADATVSVDTGDVLGDDDDGGADADAAVEVNLNDIGGDSSGGTLDTVVDDDGDGGLVNLGGDGDLVDLNSNGDSVVDMGGDGDLLELGSSGDLLDLGGGPLLDLTGDPATGAVIEADLGGGDLLDTGETGSLLNLGGSGDLLDLGSSGELLDLGSGNLLDLGDSSEDVALDLGNTSVDADLNPGSDDAPLARVTVTTDEDGVAGTGILPDTDGTATLGGGNAASVSLGTNDDAADLGGGGAGNGAGAGNGSGSGNGAAGGSGGGVAGPANGNGGSGSGGSDSGDLFAAANADASACLTLDAAQLDQLIARHTYNSATFNSWANARSLKIVEVDFCDQAVADVAAAASGSSNVARLQAFLAAQAKVSSGLRSKGYSAGDVIAADHSGEVLIVYVI